ncbi:MAG: FMN-binding glutamate synthase family protein [Thermoplasmatota archaeon]
MEPHTSLRSQYVRLPVAKRAEFWNPARIGHIRELATTGHATARWRERLEGDRALDRIDFGNAKGAERAEDAQRRASGVDASLTLARGRIAMRAPLYFGDMSFGSLSGVPNIALARAADETGALCGTGEGGLHPEVATSERITVQWASARFGVSAETLRAGLAVVIKIGQGAKPGVGGHLPAAKVTDVIRRTRRIPEGRDAISPAPHHDIYSIEDLGQRIAALKQLTGKPVFVKVAATNYAPFIACGIARMGGDGVILDGAGAGTGASPMVMKDHVGIPVEFAVAGVDRMLAREKLREGFSVIAAGTVSSPLDAARLMALGADCVSIGTASLIAMGCVMVHKCHVGTCPALLTSAAEDEPARALDLDWTTKLQVNLVRGWTEEVSAIAAGLGFARLADLVGRRDLLAAVGELDEDTAALFGVRSTRGFATRFASDVWTARIDEWLRELASGKNAGEAFVSSMGSTAPPFGESAARPVDHLRLDGAQVTRPSIDSYRERVALDLTLAGGTRLAAPLVLASPRAEHATAIAGAAHALGLVALADAWSAETRRYAARLVTPVDVAAFGVAPSGLLRFPSAETALDALADVRAPTVLIDEDAHADDRIPLEVFVAEADRRDGPAMIVSSSTLRGAGDAMKLVALGATAVAMPGAIERAIGTDAEARARTEALAFGWMREMRLLLGAAGCTSISSLVGNRELLRAVALDRATRERLGVKAAGWG